MVIGLIVIPSAALGLLRSVAINRAYFRIYTDLKNAGIELSPSELKVLISQLHRNPKAILDADSVHESRSIKEKHVRSLVSRMKLIRYAYWILMVVAIVAVVSFQNLWPKQ